MRSGWDDDSINCVEVAQMAEAAGVAMVTVHGRTRVQLYTGTADWEQIAAVKRAVGIPVLGSGDVVDVASARERWRLSGVDGLAIGRGAMEQSVALRADRAPISKVAKGLAQASRIASARSAAIGQLLDELYPPRVTAARLRGMVCRMSRGFTGSVALRDAAAHTHSREELLDVLDRFESGALDAAPLLAGAARGAEAGEVAALASAG